MKKFAILILTLLITVIQPVLSQLPEYLIPGENFEFRPHFPTKHHFPIQQFKSALQARPYDVLEYDIFLDWYRIFSSLNPTGDNRHFFGINKIKIKIDTLVLSRIELDAANILIDSVKYTKDNSKLTFVQTQDIVKITLPTHFFKDDVLQLEVHYTYIGKENRGMYIFEKGQYVGQGPPPKRDSVYVLERIAYTMSEPQNARYWLPSNDAPHDKALIKMTVKLPKGYNVATVGLRKEIRTIADSVYYFYESKYPMTTYLIAVNASKFHFEEDKYIRITNPKDTVPIHYYVWEQDWTSDTTDGTAYNAKHAFRNTVKMIEEYSKVFGEYPFEKYGMVAVQPFEFGGMEHQTMTTVNRSWLRGYSENGIAHEIAHHWLGNLVTCATWFDIWINEGGATWSEAIWYEQLYGKNVYYSYMNQIISRYFANDALFNIPIYGVPVNSIFSYPIYFLVYNKSSWVYHMLRENLGDDKFFGALKYLLEQHKYKSIETNDFVKTFKDHLIEPQFNFDKYFEQWIMKAGHPIFEISSKSSIGADYYDIEVNIRQIQEGSNVPQVFEMPIELLIYKDSLIKKTQTVYMNQRMQKFNFTIDFRPDSILINQRKILSKVVSNVLTVQNKDAEVSKQIYPNPVKIGENFNLILDITKQGPFVIEIYDILGNKVKEAFNDNLGIGNYKIEISTLGLSAGQYFIKFHNGKDSGMQRIVMMD